MYAAIGIGKYYENLIPIDIQMYVLKNHHQLNYLNHYELYHFLNNYNEFNF